MKERYAIGSRVYIRGSLAGEIVGYGADADETYLVECPMLGLAITNRARLDTPTCEVEPPKDDSYWASRQVST